MTFPKRLTIQGKEYEVESVRTLRTGERIAKAYSVHPDIGRHQVHSPGLLMRLAKLVEMDERATR